MGTPHSDKKDGHIKTTEYKQEAKKMRMEIEEMLAEWNPTLEAEFGSFLSGYDISIDTSKEDWMESGKHEDGTFFIRVRLIEKIQPYQTEKDYLQALSKALEEDYGCTLTGVELDEAGTNITFFLKSLM